MSLESNNQIYAQKGGEKQRALVKENSWALWRPKTLADGPEEKKGAFMSKSEGLYKAAEILMSAAVAGKMHKARKKNDEVKNEDEDDARIEHGRV